MWVVVGAALVSVSGATVIATGGAFGGRGRDDREIAALKAELAEVKAGLDGVAGSMHRAGARAAAAGAASLALPSFTGSPAGITASATPAAEAAPELSAEEHARIEREHHDRLDGLARKGGSAALPIARLRTNLDAILAKQAGRAGFSVESLDCSAELCRVAMRIPAETRRAGLRELYATLATGMTEMTMRPFDGDRAIFYIAPAGQRLPSPN